MIHLSRPVRVRTFDAQATVAIGRSRPEFLAVARLAADLGRPIGASDVLTQLLGQLPEVVGWRVIDRCVALGLLVRHGERGDAELSDAGNVALEHGEVLVPEEGIWRFFVVDDPLLDGSVIHAERLPDEGDKSSPDGPKGKHPPSQETPRVIKQAVQRLPDLSLVDGHLFAVAEIAQTGALGPEGTLQLHLRWQNQPTVHLVGDLEVQRGRRQRVDVSPQTTDALRRWSEEDVWMEAVSAATSTRAADLIAWRDSVGAPVLPVSFDAVPTNSRTSFVRDLEVPALSLGDLGRWEPSELQNVPLIPRTDADADAWMAWLQWDAVRDHVTPTALRAKAGELRRSFPRHQPRTLEPHDLLAQARKSADPRRWFLLAPSDLGLWS